MINVTESEYECAESDLAGICINCKNIVNHGSVEPDATRYLCEECGAAEVYGLPEALIQDLITIVEDES